MERERTLEKMNTREGYREKRGGEVSRWLTGPTTNQDERPGRRFDGDGEWNTKETCRVPTETSVIRAGRYMSKMRMRRRMGLCFLM